MRIVGRLTLGILATAYAASGQGLPPPSAWTRADQETIRLPPARFDAAPPAVRTELEHRGCLIPQPFTAKAERPENVIHGHFISASATDWAALCSRQGRSSILIFRGGGVTKVDELAPEADIDRLQTIAPGQIGYSRAITVARPNNPAVDHDGVGDAFIEKASIVWYWRGTRWQQLPDANLP